MSSVTSLKLHKNNSLELSESEDEQPQKPKRLKKRSESNCDKKLSIEERIHLSSLKLFYPMNFDVDDLIGKEIIGRTKECFQVISMIENPKDLSRPLLVGPFGIGKQSIVEKAAYLLQTHLKNACWSYTRISCLNAGLLKQTIDSFGNVQSITDHFQKYAASSCRKKNPDILYVRDIDAVIASDENYQSLQSALNEPCPMIASISGDPKDPDVVKAVSRLKKHHFEPITIDESSVEDTKIIVKKYIEKSLPFPHMGISDEAINFLIKVSSKHVQGKPFPLKAINLAYECANAKQIDLIARKQQDQSCHLSPADIASWMEVKTKISAEDLLGSFSFDEKQFASKLKEHLVGQDHAIDLVSEKVASYKMGLVDPEKPWGVYLFIGPTGVGKTELARLMAKHLYQNSQAFIRLDGTEFQESHSIARLIGAPPGYEGHESGGVLTEILKLNRHLVVLFDEFEKAHRDVRRLFLQVFDAGRLTDGRGTTVDCSQSLFIMTSNLGSDELFKLSEKEMIDVKKVKEVVTPLLVEALSPELYNRFTAAVPFNPLSQKHLPDVARVQLRSIKKRFQKDSAIDFSWDDSLIAYFSNKEFDAKLGMRAFCKAIDEEVVATLKNILSKQKESFKGQIIFSVKDDQFVLKMKKANI